MSFLFDKCSLYDLTSPDDMVDFTCGDHDLDDFFTNDCFGYARQLLGKSYCYKLDSDPTQVVCAFTLANAGIRVDDLPNARKKKIETDIPHVKSLKDYPAVLIGRLAVSMKFHSQHIGSDALEYIKYWFLDPFNKTGCRFVIVDAYNNRQTISFYERNGFKPVFSTDAQEKEYRHIQPEVTLNTRLMFFDLLTAIKA
jgi:GNAT superfamily N-acetyltransferase